MKDFLFLTLGLVVIVGSIILFLKSPSDTWQESGTISIGNTEVIVEIAHSDKERNRGLSGREGLLPGYGMLFIFETAERYGFWMKDMKFPIDIIWIGEDSRVVWIEENVSPETYPNVFLPREPAKYVLEVPSGFAEKHGVTIGAVVQ